MIDFSAKRESNENRIRCVSVNINLLGVQSEPLFVFIYLTHRGEAALFVFGSFTLTACEWLPHRDVKLQICSLTSAHLC